MVVPSKIFESMRRWAKPDFVRGVSGYAAEFAAILRSGTSRRHRNPSAWGSRRPRAGDATVWPRDDSHSGMRLGRDFGAEVASSFEPQSRTHG